MLARCILLAVALTIAAPCASESYRGTTGQIPPSKDAFYLQYESRARALRSEMIELQKADGGGLTVAHRTYLQAKADRLLAEYRENLAKVDPMSVNADGSPVR